MTLWNHTLIDQSVLKLTLIPNEKQTNFSKLEFTFNCTEFNKTSMKLQLNFENPVFISAFGYDYLQIDIVDNKYFLSKQFGVKFRKL
mgnify:CR=1 FL=1